MAAAAPSAAIVASTLEFGRNMAEVAGVALRA